MPPWLGTTIVLVLVGAMIGGIIYAMIRDRKQGKGGCSCGCAQCKYHCPSKQKTQKNEENGGQ